MIDRRDFVTGIAAAAILPAFPAAAAPPTVQDHIAAIAAKFGGIGAMEPWEYRFLEIVVKGRLRQLATDATA